ncbi:MAG TPA: MerR family transcriptional regulator [Candidatus Sulfotelmatobacter sp.]|jgi:DNA-binding transcriptional MerR regulator|nr:MerR family transcriptional regulator [Candidatus Sulfotelmatobacter sp.]
MSMHYQIGEFAELGGVSAKTLRFYDEIGLLRPAGVDARTGYRHYSSQQLGELASILALKNLGVSLTRVRQLIAKGGSASERRALLNELKRTVQQSIEEAAQGLNWIDAALEELGERQSPIAVIVKRRPAVRIASLRVRLNNYAEVTGFERELSNALPPDCVGSIRGVLWHRCADSGTLEAEPFVALKKTIRAKVPCERKQLPEATLACAYSDLDDESAEQAYGAIRRWMNVRGYRLAGPKRELYLGEMLEIQFPLAENLA